MAMLIRASASHSWDNVNPEVVTANSFIPTSAAPVPPAFQRTFSAVDQPAQDAVSLRTASCAGCVGLQLRGIFTKTVQGRKNRPSYQGLTAIGRSAL
jgi:hypothetical protein